MNEDEIPNEGEDEIPNEPEEGIASEAGDEIPSEGAPEGEGRYVPELGEELSQTEQFEQLWDTGEESAQATEEDEEEILRELYGEPDENGIFSGEVS